MNEIQEAIAYFKQLDRRAISNNFSTGNLLRTAIFALEKQVPQEPMAHVAEERTEVRPHVFFGRGTTLYHCPVCSKLLTPSEAYCDGCGQKLDWGERREGGPR